MRTSAVSDVMVLEIDQTLVRVSAVHGVVRASSAHPPQRSSTSVPRSTTARLAPSSSPLSRCCWNASRRAENRSSATPWTGVLVIEPSPAIGRSCVLWRQHTARSVCVTGMRANDVDRGGPGADRGSRARTLRRARTVRAVEAVHRRHAGARRPRPGRGAGADRGGRGAATPTCPSSTATASGRRRCCSATRRRASSKRSATASTTWRVGDRVVMTFLPRCGDCAGVRDRRAAAVPGRQRGERRSALLVGGHRLHSRRRRRARPPPPRRVRVRQPRRGQPHLRRPGRPRRPARGRGAARLRGAHRRRRGGQRRPSAGG